MSIITLNTRSLPDSAVTTAKIAADAITDAKIADDVVGTEHLTAGEVDATALGADSVTAAKINNDIISGSTELASEPADTDEFLVSDAGTLKRIDYSLIKGSGVAITKVEDTTDHSHTNQGETVFGSGLTFTPASTTSQVVAFTEVSGQVSNDGSDNDNRTQIKFGTDNSSGNTIFESNSITNVGHTNMQASNHTMYFFQTGVIGTCQRNSSNNVVLKVTGNSNLDSGTTVYVYNIKTIFMEIG